MKQENLSIAIGLLSDMHDSKLITAIQFEDGSGTKFNYQLNGGSEWLYKDLTKAFKVLRANDTYFTTIGRAIDYAVDTASIKGYLTMTDNMVIYPGIEIGETKSFHVDLYKDNNLQAKQLHIIIYRMDSGNYELTHYIN